MADMLLSPLSFAVAIPLPESPLLPSNGASSSQASTPRSYASVCSTPRARPKSPTTPIPRLAPSPVRPPIVSLPHSAAPPKRKDGIPLFSFLPPPRVRLPGQQAVSTARPGHKASECKNKKTPRVRNDAKLPEKNGRTPDLKSSIKIPPAHEVKPSVPTPSRAPDSKSSKPKVAKDRKHIPRRKNVIDGLVKTVDKLQREVEVLRKGLRSVKKHCLCGVKCRDVEAGPSPAKREVFPSPPQQTPDLKSEQTSKLESTPRATPALLPPLPLPPTPFFNPACSSSLDKHTGLYTNPAIQQVINEVLFKNKSDDGIKWAKYYNPFPRVAFALALTAIECAIDEWASGSREMISFKEDEYSGIFNSHLTSLDEFSKAAGKLDLLKKLLEQVYSTGCIHAGVAAKNTKEQKKAIPSRAFLNAIRDYQMADVNDSY
ncbi:hypothetical protein EDD15DRAFT_2488240 [Pisolithus albus]|nr:hypothetical protein EDD15DRAFT_2488240 [Pisolithus albus]